MNIKIINTLDSRPDDINISLFESLRQEFMDNDSIMLVDENPDIIHIFGSWDNMSLEAVRKYRDREIPIVFTASDGLVALGVSKNSQKISVKVRSFIKKISQVVSAIHVCGTIESAIIKKQCQKVNLFCIGNCNYTSLISKQKMLYDFCHMYIAVAKKYEEGIRLAIEHKIKDAGITDATLIKMVSKVYYLHYLQIKGSIPQQYIDDLSEIFTKVDCDEQQLRIALRKVKLYQFTSRTMQMLTDCSTLTEGFMPLPPINDKMTNSLKACIIKKP